MGAWIDSTSYLNIADRSAFINDGILRTYGYEELTDSFLDEVAANPKIKVIQIKTDVSDLTFERINMILQKRNDIKFRVYSLGSDGNQNFKFSRLYLLKSLQHLSIDGHIRDQRDWYDFSEVCNLQNLKTLDLNVFDLKDYRFVQELPSTLQSICIMADATESIIFDCKWLLNYPQLSEVSLAKKARKNIRKIAELPMLESFVMRGIKLPDLEFLRGCSKLKSFSLLYCAMNDLNTLRDFTQLKQLELWMIRKLEDISFISTLTGLERLRLSNLPHIETLPNLSALKNLKEISIDGVPLDQEKVPDHIKTLIKYEPFWYR